MSDEDLGLIQAVIEKENFTSAEEKDVKGGKMLSLFLASGRRVIVLSQKSSSDAFHDQVTVGGQLVTLLESLKIKQVTLFVSDPAKAARFSEGALLRAWRFDDYKKQKDTLENLTVVTEEVGRFQEIFETRRLVAESVLWSRRLVNMPSNALTPKDVVAEMKALEETGLVFEVLDRERMKDLGMNALLGVAQGSEEPPFLGILKWQGAKTDQQPMAFVGKGVTFDSGGLSLKPPAGMEDMKGDMGGSAVVLGLMRALALTKAPLNAVGVVALVENMPSGTAQRPGDIVRAMNGKTIEVLNTDAEGRLILADALAYTEKNFAPSVIVDVATLTGAMRYALGPQYAGLFTPEDELAHGLTDAGEHVGELLWRLPLCEAFTKAMEGSVSDLKNISSPGFGAGSSTAAAFLQCFVEKTPWAHLDIANVDMQTQDKDLATAGGVTFGLRLLYHWACRRVA